MQTLARLFKGSPFAPLQAHMAKVSECVRELEPLFEALRKKDYALVNALADKISKLEHDADLTKNDIRNHLPTSLFLPIARTSLLEILSLQDDIADTAENIATLLTLRQIEIEGFFAEEFNAFLKKNLETFYEVHKVIQELGDLLESSFGGLEAEKVKKMVDSVAYKEHESDVLQQKLLQKLFTQCDAMPCPLFHLWQKVTREISGLSNISESLANRVRMTLEVK